MFHKLSISSTEAPACFASLTLRSEGRTYIVIAGDTSAERLVDHVYAEICRVYRTVDLGTATILWVSPPEFSNGRRLVHKLFVCDIYYPVETVEIEESNISVSVELQAAVANCESELLRAMQPRTKDSPSASLRLRV